MFVKSQGGATVLNYDKVTKYRAEYKYEGLSEVVAYVGDEKNVLGRYSTRQKCIDAISMLLECYTMNLMFDRGNENPRDLVCDYVADQPLGIFEMPQESEV